jgi:cytochrome b6-f complex iron-sulfur subunit
MSDTKTKDGATVTAPARQAPPSAQSGTDQATGAQDRSDSSPDGSRNPQRRRRFIWGCISAFLATNFLMFLRFFFPRTLFEPKTVFTVGGESDFGLGVDTKFQAQYRIWVVRTASRLFVIYARCTHLGCTPDWKPSENKFKCPCHGSGYDSEGINFEGPAPRPMDRAKVELDVQGRIVVDTSKLFSCPKGGRCEFDDPGSFLPL